MPPAPVGATHPRSHPFSGERVLGWEGSVGGDRRRAAADCSMILHRTGLGRSRTLRVLVALALGVRVARKCQRAFGGNFILPAATPRDVCVAERPCGLATIIRQCALLWCARLRRSLLRYSGSETAVTIFCGNAADGPSACRRRDGRVACPVLPKFVRTNLQISSKKFGGCGTGQVNRAAARSHSHHRPASPASPLPSHRVRRAAPK